MLVMYQHLHYHFPPASRKIEKKNLNAKGNFAKKKKSLVISKTQLSLFKCLEPGTNFIQPVEVIS